MVTNLFLSKLFESQEGFKWSLKMTWGLNHVLLIHGLSSLSNLSKRVRGVERALELFLAGVVPGPGVVLLDGVQQLCWCYEPRRRPLPGRLKTVCRYSCIEIAAVVDFSRSYSLNNLTYYFHFTFNLCPPVRFLKLLHFI